MRNWGFRVNYLLKSRFFVFILLSALVLSSLAPFFINSEVCRTEDSSSSTQNVEIEPDDIIELTNSHNSDKTVNPNADLNIKPLLTPDQKSSPITNSGSTLNTCIRMAGNYPGFYLCNTHPSIGYR